MTIVLSVLLLGNCVSVEKHLGMSAGEGHGETPQKGCTPAQAAGTVLGNVFIKDGYGTKWNYRINKLAYMRHQPDGYYKIFVSDPDGRNEKSLTTGHPSLPQRHHGVPDWHPSGKYLVFVAEKPEHAESSAAALPGFGGYSDIWLIMADGSTVWKLVELANSRHTGVLLPRFTREGEKMTWAERVKGGQLFNQLLLAGSYVIKVADFVESPEPHLEHIRVYQPGGPGFYEASDFSPEGRFLLFTSNYETRNFWKNQIYRLDLETGQVLRLTEEDYNEHPAYTPDGKAIIYMSGYQTDFLFPARGADWWLMNPDGTNRRRITFINTRRHAQSMGGPLWAITAVAWSPDGEWFYGDVQSNLITQRGDVIKVFLRCNGQ
jgi:Tol biopolymer transport system component